MLPVLTVDCAHMVIGNIKTMANTKDHRCIAAEESFALSICLPLAKFFVCVGNWHQQNNRLLYKEP
jgi:hypothetical protein